MKIKKVCEHCGASMMEYRHSLSKPLVLALKALYDKEQTVTGPVNLKELGLTRNAWDNFQKLKYWGLVAQVGQKKGIWMTTSVGVSFLSGETLLNKGVRTYRGVPVKFEGIKVSFADVTVTEDRFKERVEYAQDAVPAGS